MTKEQDVYSTPDSDVAFTSASVHSPSIKEIYFGFSGRLNRQRYWLSYLVFTVVMVVIIAALVGMAGPEAEPSPVLLLLYIPLIWVSLAIQIKRFHDRDKSGWWVLISFIPIIGPLWLLVELGFLSGDDGANRFGPPVI